ncbi:protein FAR-RED IMPAIRED RESPONSE 1-like [Tripterygium wilfordii]|uniref:protein FAR-RED IMPAIRED RESPONSE 1-like n=1 Tax=Tripterygium wilfordii TaxID=458696 RepID=UPI0018F7F52A|nr:protein FAR-RED IMPAIRED RESPONSE 1-like [Tripterygium wilfordii]
MSVDNDKDWTPYIDMEFNTLDEAWEHWCHYGKQVGFSTRKSFVNRSKLNGKVTSRGFVCSKEGVRQEDKRRVHSNHRDETRTNCHARLFVRLIQKSGKYIVYDFVDEHNHQLHLPQTTYMMRSQRRISAVQARTIDLVHSVGIKPTNADELMSREAGWRDSLEYIASDQNTYLRTRREKAMKYGEAGSILRYFQDEQIKNPSFHYVFQLDNEEKITNIFWVDAKMIVDYSYFGDVVTFDTTYGTNKDLRPLAVFTGFNHHRGVVIFGAALLYDETVDSFKWLFKSFLDAHKCKWPQTILTDQDAAMARALKDEMPNTFHGLCDWHIMQNAIKHLGNRMKDGDSSLLRDFKQCMFEYESETEFEEAWKKLIETYSFPDSSWLDDMYKLKERWARCHLKKAFTLGMRSTELSERLNADVKNYLRSDVNIVEFFEQFERVVQQKREKELLAEFNSREKMPTLSLKRSPILQQAARVYTPIIFQFFQNEIDCLSAAKIKDRDDSNPTKKYLIELLDEVGEYIVLYTPSSVTITCSCRLFETFGILCCHTLKVLDHLDIKSIPKSYILKRWTREAKLGYTADNEEIVEGNHSLEITQRYKRICPRMVRLASRASEDKETFALVERLLEDLEKQVDNILVSKSAPDHPDKPAETLNLSQKGGSTEKVKGLKRRIVRNGGNQPRSFMELNTRQKAMKSTEESSTHQSPQETQSPNAPILQCSSEQNVREMETRSPNPMTRSSCTPQHNVQGLDTPSPNGVACYGHNPQQNVQGLVPLSIMGQTHPGYYINQQSMQGLNFGSIQNRE